MMTDIEKIELSIRRLAARYEQRTPAFHGLLTDIADQIARDWSTTAGQNGTSRI